jgi:hypothetical protein
MEVEVNRVKVIGTHMAYEFDLELNYDAILYLEIEDAGSEYYGTLYYDGTNGEEDPELICEFGIQDSWMPRYDIDAWMLLRKVSHKIIGGLWK